MAAMFRSVPVRGLPMPSAAAPALRRIFFLDPAPAVAVRQKRPVAQWRRGADGRLECRWRRAAAPLPRDRGAGLGRSFATRLACEDLGS